MKRLIGIGIIILSLFIAFDSSEAKKIVLTIPDIETTTEIRLSRLVIDWDSKTVSLEYNLGYENGGQFISTSENRIVKEGSGFTNTLNAINIDLEGLILNKVKAKHAGTIE